MNSFVSYGDAAYFINVAGDVYRFDTQSKLISPMIVQKAKDEKFKPFDLN